VELSAGVSVADGRHLTVRRGFQTPLPAGRKGRGGARGIEYGGRGGTIPRARRRADRISPQQKRRKLSSQMFPSILRGWKRALTALYESNGRNIQAGLRIDTIARSEKNFPGEAKMAASLERFIRTTVP